jgi:hypothetical protein
MPDKKDKKRKQNNRDSDSTFFMHVMKQLRYNPSDKKSSKSIKNNSDGDIIIFSDFMKQLRYIRPEEYGHTKYNMIRFIENSHDKNIYTENQYKSNFFELSKEFKKENQYYVMTYNIPRWGDVVLSNSFNMHSVDDETTIYEYKTPTIVQYIDTSDAGLTINLDNDSIKIPLVACQYCKIVAKIAIPEHIFIRYKLNKKYYISHSQYYIPSEHIKSLVNAKLYNTDKLYMYSGGIHEDKQ